MARHGKRMAMAAALLLAVAILLPPFINVNRYRLDVANAMGRALGRQVTVGAISMRLLPEPGFVLENVVVADDPSINAEPLLRADAVRASLRLSSLWRGRLEVSKLSLTDPSLNLVRAADGRWNLQSLLSRVSQTPAAPTAKIRPESRPRFPYIEADGGRINLKLGVEKTVYALTNAQFALWLASENQWQVRLRANAIRTDANLGDTGDLRVEGSLGRADRLGVTPLDLRFRLQDAQLGQLTHVLYGRDRGWRGSTTLDAHLKGTPEQMRASVAARVDDFRRYDIMSGGALRLAAQCEAAISITRQQITNARCDAPVGSGHIIATGNVDGFIMRRAYDVNVTIEDLPASGAIALARHMKRDLPEDLTAAGVVGASFALRRNSGMSLTWSGQGNASALQVTTAQLETPLALGNIRFVLATEETIGAQARDGVETLHSMTTPGRPYLQVPSFPLRLGGATPASAQARFSGSGYVVQLQGDASLPRLIQLAHAAGIAAPQTVASGASHLDLQLAGGWTGFAAPALTGVAQLRNDTARIAGIAQPLQIASATLTVSDDAVRVQNLSASFAGTHSAITGALTLPRRCPVQACPVEFQLKADQLSTDELDHLLNPRLRSRPWYQMIGLASGPEHSPLSALEAQGQIAIAKLLVKSVAANHLAANVRISHGKLALTNVSAEVLGGTHSGEWRADFTGAAPAYTGEGTLDGVLLARLGSLMQDDWASGKANLAYRASAAGWTASDLLKSAAGSVSFDWRDGTLSRVALGDQPPLRFRRFAGRLALHDGLLAFEPSKMEAANGIYSISGTASLDRRLSLRLARNGAPAFDVTGTLAKPRVVRATPSQTATLATP